MQCGALRRGHSRDPGVIQAADLGSDEAGSDLIKVAAWLAKPRSGRGVRGKHLRATHSEIPFIAVRYRYGNIAEVGNTAAASIPLAMADTVANSRVRPGARSPLTAFGGGLTWDQLP
ncbi:3-oxoacyl-[acyl-carrier-protein] synthase III C-terminal domain-containing protein [Streptomyces shenzhenensis]